MMVSFISKRTKAFTIGVLRKKELDILRKGKEGNRY